MPGLLLIDWAVASRMAPAQVLMAKVTFGPMTHGEGPDRMTVPMEAGVVKRPVGAAPSAREMMPGPSPHRTGQLDDALAATRNHLVETQDPDGFWVGELEGDSILESEYILLMAYLGRVRDPLCIKMIRVILAEQNDEGGWSTYPGGPSQVSATVKSYFVLKMLGRPVNDPVMVRARAVVHQMGGAQMCNSFTRFYLALLGQIDYADVPYVPPELLFVPPKMPFSLASMSSWTRTIIVPLMIISRFKPVRKLKDDEGIAELFLPGPKVTPKRFPAVSWGNFFVQADRLMKWLDARIPAAWRDHGVKKAHRWILDHCENSDGLGAISPPMIYSIVAFGCLGYARDSAIVTWAHRQLDGLVIEEEAHAWVQPSLSPVWDTAIAMIALANSGLPANHPTLIRSSQWLLEKEVRVEGDWAARGIKATPTGWHFQYHNERYPDIDDSAMVLLALQTSTLRTDPEVVAATQRGVDWLLALQNTDGSWAAYDKDINNEVLTKVPFADHNAMLDPGCADITARVIELLGTLGHDAQHPAIQRGLDYLWRTQEAEGCWYGRWGVNYIYGTWQVFQGLKAINFAMDHPSLVRAADWLESVQQADGSWGESCHTYDDPSIKGQGNPTPSQTAWGVLGLVSAGRADSDAVRRGVNWLLEAQKDDGTWFDDTYTGTGFPSVFYLRYHLYPISFATMALARYRAAIGNSA